MCLLVSGVMVVGTGKGAFIVGVATGSKLLSTDSSPVVLSLPILVLLIIQIPMDRKFQVEVAYNLLSWVLSSINLVLEERTKLQV